ncbi:MAG: M48 family metallopeptidase [Bacteroidia bacterium]|nr:M48 family metallopeptidase [Bacteroidia bacterium]
MKRRILLYTFLFCVLLTKAQIYQLMPFPEKVDKKYILLPLKDEEKYRKKVQKKIPKKHLKPFTYSCAFGKSDMFKDGKIYLSWPALESYVNQVLDSIMPDNLKNKKIKAFIGRSSEINAFCLYDGTMIVNVGLIAEAKNEAALATIMGHELGHHIKEHVLNDYVKSVKEKSRRKEDELALAIKRKGYSQQLELEADDLGYSIAKNAGYDVSQAISNFELFIREKEYYQKRTSSDLVNGDTVKIKTKSGIYSANTLEKLLSTHPDEKERKEKLIAFVKNNNSTKKLLNKMDATTFATLQKQARLESIGLIFGEHNYAECLERAFRFHLFEPNESTYHYYITESIRRLCLLDYTLRKKGFLAENLINNGFNEGTGILADLKFLIPNEEMYKNITATELLNAAAPPFQTYREAFYYFNEKLIKKDFAEAHLMAALFENNKEKQKTSIDKYLAHPKALRKEYAKNYLNNTLTSSILNNSGEIVMIPQVDYFSHTKYTKTISYGRTRYNYGKSEMVGGELATDISKSFNTRLPNTKSISLPQASVENFNTKEKYEEIIISTSLAQREENEGYEMVHYYKELEDEDYIGKVDIFRLNPEIWDFFNKEKINTITYARYTRHFSEMDHILRRPALYMGIPTLGFTWLFLPFRIANSKRLDLYSYDSRAGETLSSSKIKGYWLTPKKAVKMFKKSKKEKEKYIQEVYGKN